MFNFNCGCCREKQCDCDHWDNCQQHRPCHKNRNCGWNICLGFNNKCFNQCHCHQSCRPCHNNPWDNNLQCSHCKQCGSRSMNDFDDFRQDNFDRNFDNNFNSNNFNFSNFNRGGCSNVRPIFIDNDRFGFGNGCEVSVINPTVTG